MLGTPLGRLRMIALIEGWSYIILLLLAMPLKYFADWPMAVRVVGSLHGALFVLYIVSVAEVTIRRPWWSLGFWAISAVASIIPFGTFFYERWLKRIEQEDLARSGAASTRTADPSMA